MGSSKTYQLSKIVLVLFLMLGASFADQEIFAQESDKKDLTHVKDTDIRKEEIQRYIGYEKLLYRYFSLPYDTTMNINERGNFVDIGFLYLMFLPLMVIILIRRENKVLSWLIGIMMVSMFIISTSNSFLLDTSQGLNPTSNQMIKNSDGVFQSQYTGTFSDSPSTFITNKIYLLNNILYKPFALLGYTITGQSDHFTYPILILLFILSGFFIHRLLSSKDSTNISTIGYLFFNYSFFWLVLSSGIVWYGFFMLFLGLIMMLYLLQKIKEREPFQYKWLKPVFVGFVSIWIFMCFTNKISSITPGIPESQYGKGLFHSIFFDYNTGKKSEKDVLERIYPSIYDVFRTINKNQKNLVYRVGTSFSYFVENNHERVYADNQLGLFNALTIKYTDKEELARVLKASGFKYMIIDFNTVTIDKTTEKSLTRKYNSLMNFLFKNSHVKVLATNRVIKVRNEQTGQDQNYYGIFGKDIVFNGSYAIVELI